MATVKKTSSKVTSANSLRYNPRYEAKIIYMNDGVRICTLAAASHWGDKVPKHYEDEVEYLNEILISKYPPVLDHSNIITLIKMPNTINTNDPIISMMDILCSSKYLNAVVKQDSEYHVSYILIGGSITGYTDLFNTCNDPRNNNIMRSIANQLYTYSDNRLFPDLVSNDILTEEIFANVEPDPVDRVFNPMKSIYEDKVVNFISVDSIPSIRANLVREIGEDIFTDDDIGKVATLTVLFKNMPANAMYHLYNSMISNRLMGIRFYYSSEITNEQYMTFTYNTFNQFLELKDTGVVEEIRDAASSCIKGFESVINELDSTDTTVPKVDEIITDKEVILNKIIENEPELQEEKNNG